MHVGTFGISGAIQRVRIAVRNDILSSLMSSCSFTPWTSRRDIIFSSGSCVLSLIWLAVPMDIDFCLGSAVKPATKDFSSLAQLAPFCPVKEILFLWNSSFASTVCVSSVHERCPRNFVSLE
eukprot:TRINITY_DN4912_c0_g1_i4.p1 TRINITY_DN4912_c0_g1~~TRINITY_DN4912_c0_g1_i4.p1  ORF type:complete len:122 (-),score=9.72 TRINITY_DN4912_c0_g1_i4:97-462(-)